MANPPTDLDVWVLAGQSNMQGRGLLEGALQPDPRVWSDNAEPGVRLGYGLGVDPCCALVDSVDMPWCSFLPRTIEQ